MCAALDLSNAASILIVKPSSLGDVVHTIPAAGLIAAAHPHLDIHWLVNPEWAPLIDGLPWLRAVIPFPRQRFRGLSGPGRFWSWRRELRAAMPDSPDGPHGPVISIDFQGLLRSGLASKWSGADVRIGLSDSREGARFFHSDIVQTDPADHAVDRYLAVVRSLGITVPELPEQLPWQLPAGDPIPSDTLQGVPPESLIVLHPFSRGDGKSLSAGQVRQFCNELGTVPVVVVGRGETIRDLPGNAQCLLNQTSLPQLVWLMREAGYVVSVDSGPMHIAAAASPNVLGIHTWSDPGKVGPYRSEAWVFKGGKFFHRADCPSSLRSARCTISSEDIQNLAAFVSNQFAAADSGN